MFVLLSKLLDLAVAPLTWALLLALLSLLWTGRRPGRARLSLVLSLGLLLAFSLGPVSRRLAAALERGVTSTFHPDPPYDAVVVLGGVLDPNGADPAELSLGDAAERITRAAEVLRAGQARAVLLSGGAVFPRPGVVPEADDLARWLRTQGIPADRIVIEDRSRNTHENAVESAAVIAAHGWRRVAVLTSAWHAPRAMGCFRAVGLAPDLLAVDHRAGGPGDASWLPRAAHLSESTDALRELTGRLVYRLVGYAR